MTEEDGWLPGYVYMSYAHAYAFGAYLMRSFGGAELLRRIVHNAETTEAAVVQAVAEMGHTKTFGELLAMWGAAGLLSDSVPGPDLYAYNTGDYFSSTLGSGTYEYGSIDLYNYRYYDSETTWLDGPWVYTDLLPVQYGSCNTLYQAGLGLTGTKSWDMSLPVGVTLTVVEK
jgi:hypothetical protein